MYSGGCLKSSPQDNDSFGWCQTEISIAYCLLLIRSGGRAARTCVFVDQTEHLCDPSVTNGSTRRDCAAPAKPHDLSAATTARADSAVLPNPKILLNPVRVEKGQVKGCGKIGREKLLHTKFQQA
jgi:hypothetical protein